MTVTPASLRAAYDEFSTAPDALVQARIDYATQQCDSTAWGALLDQGITLLACHMLALSPSARDLRLQQDSANTVYWLQYCDLRHKIGLVASLRVA
jgi:hypothetical protein